jgi:hypothetical protein
MGAAVSCNNPEYPSANIMTGKCYKKCPDGFVHDIDDWSKCMPRNSPQPYSREVGSPVTCPDGKERQLGFCYTPCQKGLIGRGPRCVQDIRNMGPPIDSDNK